MATIPGLQPVYVLHRRAHGDNNLLVDLFSRDQGRLTVMARGAHKGRRASLLQPFVPLVADWRGRGEIPTLNHVEAAAKGVRLQGRRLICGLYLNELLVRLLRQHDPQLQLFALYSQSLGALCEADEEGVLRGFELDLLQELGFGLQLEYEAASDTPVDPRRRYHYRLEAGPIHAHDDHQLQVSGQTLLHLAQRLPLDAEGRREARALLRYALSAHLGGRPLKSRELFRTTSHRAAP